MAVRIAGGVPIEVPLDPANGFQLRLADLQAYLDDADGAPLVPMLAPTNRSPAATAAQTQPGKGVRAVILCTPNNPTGTVYEADELVRIARTLAAHDVVLLIDETYRHLIYGEAAHFCPAALPEARNHVLTIGSFSKSYSLTGWRIGYLIAPAPFLEEAIKVQDTMVICATVIAQKAALGALQEDAAFLVERRATLDRRRRLLAQHLATIPGLHWQPTEGAFFAFARVEGCTDSLQLAMDILEQAHVVTIPGSLFGPAGEGYLRLSYGSAEEVELAEACARLEKFFSNSEIRTWNL
jgi:aminotransferase